MAARIKKGDKVVVLSGRDKGRSGEVLKIFPSADRALVQGINTAKRHQRQTQAEVQPSMSLGLFPPIEEDSEVDEEEQELIHTLWPPPTNVKGDQRQLAAWLHYLRTCTRAGRTI